jgi:cytosine/creatinine deaminase
MKVRSGVTSDLSSLHLNGRTVSLRLDQGRIAAIEPAPGIAKHVILPLPIDPHVHLDKTFTAHRCRASKPGLFGAIEAMAADKANWTEDDLRARIGQGMVDAYANGVTALRSHVDWTEPSVPLAWAVMGEAAQDWSGRMRLQRSALVSIDLLSDADIGPVIAATVAKNGDVLGTYIYRHDDFAAKLARVFALAVRHDLPLDFHVDEGLDVDASAFDTIVALTAKHGLGGRVLCGHACSLAIRPEAEVTRAITAAADAGVAVTVMPSTNLYLQDMTPGRSPRLRGLAPMQELRSAGVQVLLAADNVADPFYPYGTYDPLDTLRLATIAAHIDPGDWLDAITTSPARAMGLATPKIAVGAPADFMLINGADWREAISNPRAIRQIYRAGSVTHSKAAA